jgi:hypothetical protein
VQCLTHAASETVSTVIKNYILIAKKNTNLFTSKLDLNLRKKLVKCYIPSIALHDPETWTLRKADHKYLESFETVILEKDGEDQLD